jgi:RHS repeat-associated protein
MAEWLGNIGQFGKGMGQGVWNFGKDTVTGIADMGKAGYQLATDGAYREQAYQTATAVASMAKQGIGSAIADPKAALNSMRNKVGAAYDALQVERAQAAAEGRLAEFDGQLAGRGLSEVASLLIPVSKIGALGKAGEMLSEAKNVEHAADVVKAEATAVKAIEEGGLLAKHPPTIKEPCPLETSTKTPKANVSNEIAETPTNKKSALCSATETGGCPISMVTGEELLALVDFSWDGPLTIQWSRFYRTAQTATDLQLGFGWLTPLDEWLDVSINGVDYHDKEGRVVKLPLPEMNAASRNLPEQLQLVRETGQFRLISADGLERVFQDQPGHCHLLRWQNENHFIELIYDLQNQVQALKASWGKSLFIQRNGARIAAIGLGKQSDKGWEFSAVPYVRYGYNEVGDLTGVANRLNQGESYAYQNHVITQRTLASGFNFHFEWDSYTPSGRCIRNYGDNGIYNYRFQWTDSGISRAIDSRGGVTEFMHDKNALLLWKTSPEGHTTHYAYDHNNQLCSITNAAGNSSHYNYDDEGRLTKAVNALGQTSQLAYNVDGKPITFTDPIGQVWKRAYDQQGRLQQSQDPQGGITQFVYNEQGLLAQVINAITQTRTLLWDDQARLVADIGFNGVRRRYQYDAEDRIIAVSTQDKLTSHYQYDAAGRVIAVKAPDGAITRLQYNAAGQLTHYTDAANRTTEYRYADGLGQITERINPAGYALCYHYDSERNLVGLTNAKGEQYQLNYDKDENLIEEIGFDGRIQRYRYDITGNLEAYAQRGDETLGQPDWLVSQFERDPLGRLLKKTGWDGAVSDFGYDGLGRLHQAQNTHSALHFHYNSLGQVIQETQNEATVAHEYDLLGRRTATITPTGQRIEYSYNKQGALQTVTLDGEIVSKHQFDDLGQETARQQGALVSHYDYDPMGRLIKQQAKLDNNSTILGRQYAYDITGKLSGLNDFRQGQSQYIYDPSDRLIQVEGITPETFVHDPADNLIGTNQEVGGLVKGDRLLMMGDRHYTYDAAGNLIEEKRGKGGQIVSRYQYDSDNRLIRAETATGNSSYKYDPLGRRISKQTSQGEACFVYDGSRLLAESQDQQQHTYLFEPVSFRPLARIDQDCGQSVKTIYYYHLDQLGTPKEMTDSSGRIVWSAKYLAYGSLAFADTTLVDNHLRLQGQYFDAETGLHYNLNRYYDPSAGRFIHQDPIGLAGGENLFRYTANPVNWVDPFGLTPLLLPAPTTLDPWGAGAKLESIAVPKGGILVEMAMSPGQFNPGGWATLDHIPDVEYVRNKLAVIPEFKPEISHVQTFHIPEGIQIQTGPVGPQMSGGNLYPGGGSQIQILNYEDRAKLKPIGAPRKISLRDCGG